MVEPCIGCGARGGPVCAACECLAAAELEISAARSLLILPAVVTVVLGLAFVGTLGLLDSVHPWKGRAIGAAGIGFALSAGWTLRELRGLRRIRLDAGGLRLGDGFGGRRRVPLGDLEVEFGRVRDRGTGRTFRVGESRFPGATDFHRALRVRLSRASGDAGASPIC